MDLESEIDIFYDCDECDKTFPSTGKMLDHKRKVHIKPYVCKFCDHRFGCTTNLKQHILNQHTKKEPASHSCEFCKSAFSKRSLLTLHLREAHAEQKLNHCELCGKSFFSKLGLKSHTRVVHSVKLIKCMDCAQSFNLESELEKHIDRDHLQLGKQAQNYKCDECGKSLPDGCLFHVCKNEIPLTCVECGDNFMNTFEFKEHRRTAHATMKHACPECAKEFVLKDKLESHIRYFHFDKIKMHKTEVTEEYKPETTSECVKKHKCVICKVAFARPENLKRHRQRMHKEKVNE